MNVTLPYNARRRQLTEARVNEIKDYIREHPKAEQTEMLNVLAKRWRVTVRTARIPLEYCKRHGIVESKKKITTFLKVR